MNKELNSSAIVVVFATVGLVFGIITILFSFIPIFGSLAFLIGVPSLIISGLSLYISFIRNAKRNLSIIALTVCFIGIFLSGAQFLSIRSIGIYSKKKLMNLNTNDVNQVDCYNVSNKLINRLNGCYNLREYNKLIEIYRPNGLRMNDIEITEYKKGVDLLFQNSGKIVGYKLTNINRNGNIIYVKAITNYEKTGNIEEEFKILLINKDNFITDIN